MHLDVVDQVPGSLLQDRVEAEKEKFGKHVILE
jgi:hypothetical protein